MPQTYHEPDDFIWCFLDPIPREKTLHIGVYQLVPHLVRVQIHFNPDARASRLVIAVRREPFDLKRGKRGDASNTSPPTDSRLRILHSILHVIIEWAEKTFTMSSRAGGCIHPFTGFISFEESVRCVARYGSVAC